MRIACLAAAFCLAATAPALSWGASGHKIVAQIAARHLTPEAGQEVQKLLAAQQEKNMPAVSNWADALRAELPDTSQPLHSVRLPLDHRPYDAKRDCRKRGCVISALALNTTVLADFSAGTPARAAALNYVIHFVGDIHQPLHTSVDIGLRKVWLDGEETTLHKVWDTGILRRAGKPWKTLAEELDAEGACPAGDASAPLDWALEGRAIARDQIFADLRIQTVAEPKLGDDYLDENLPIVRQRLKQAGCRLAAVLNQALTRPAAPTAGDGPAGEPSSTIDILKSLFSIR
ncbi:MAG: S1/P1 nuclease [Rhizobiaceae bacterium]|nr:S1/P1 nuclease [Rhizobiaceae bacterium]